MVAVLTHIAAVDYRGCAKSKDGGSDDAAHADGQGFHGVVSIMKGMKDMDEKSGDAQAE